MKQNKLFLGLATLFAVAFTFTACSSDDAESQSVQQDRTIRLTSSVERGSTRATTDPQSSKSLSTNSKLAIWAINQTGPAALTNGNNEQYTVDNLGNLAPSTSGHTMNWPNDATLDFYAYAPYNSGYSYNAANTFSVQTDQSTEANYLASDLVLAKATGKTYAANTPVALQFNHLLSKINITINKAENATVDLSKAKVTITNTKLKTNFKPSATDESSDKILTEVTTDNDATNILAVSALGTATTACAIIVPQQIAAGTALVKIETTSEATSGANRTLIAKLSAATTFASGQSYNFTVTVNDADAGTTQEVELQLGSASLVEWGDQDLGAVTEEPYTIGDYVLNDGTFLRQSQLASASDEVKAKISAVIFSKTSHDTGWDGYAVSIEGKLSTNNLAWSTAAGSVGTLKANLSEAIADYSGLSTKTTASANYEAYPVFQCTGAPEITGTNLSDWFIPSVGQMVDIIQNLGEQSDIRSTITTAGASQSGNNNISIPTSISTFLPKINAYAVAVKGEGKVIITASGDGSSDGNCFQYVTSTEKDDSNMWMIKFPAANAENQLIYLSKAAGKTSTSNRNVLPIIAFKFPTE